MVDSPDEPSLLDRSRSSPTHASSNPFGAGSHNPASTLDGKPAIGHSETSPRHIAKDGIVNSTNPSGSANNHHVADSISTALPPPAPPPNEKGQGAESTTIIDEENEEKPTILFRFYACCKDILFASWINVLLVFVPVGIVVQAAGVDKTIVFAMNAIAIVPLAGLLSYATESVASEMGDTIGALMNVTFGNAVELIIFIALAKNEIGIVQASLLGSILANLLFILGMCFLFGGLRFQEQIYNSTVTQMSACLLSLSVMSLLLPTAFHASFTDNAKADQAVLQISRGTSIILLLVYVLYLLFQLRTHAYLYQSTPQHVIDEESHPGLLHDVFDTSSSSNDSSSSSGTDSDESSGSNTTAKRIKRVLTRGRKRRKSSAGSTDTPSALSTIRTPSANTFSPAADEKEHSQFAPMTSTSNSTILASGEDADDERTAPHRSIEKRQPTVNFLDFEKTASSSSTTSPELKKHKKSKRKHRKAERLNEKSAEIPQMPERTNAKTLVDSTPRPSTSRVVDFQDRALTAAENSPKRPFNIRGRSVRDALPAIPAMPKLMTNTVFSTANPNGQVNVPIAVTGITPRALHRSNSLPGRLDQAARQTSRQAPAAPPLQPQPYLAPVTNADTANDADVKPHKKYMSRNAAMLLLVISTGLVAVCAEFLVASIDHLVDNTSVSQAFIGLIILPIVGNAAEHVTAVTVASKNKMDLAIGVAVGSSIQIALFVTPVIVLLGWMMGKAMTLYFSLFETISLFVSAFIVNFLVLDGRSNYLEGALLIAAYIIIAVAAFFYPDPDETSKISGSNAGHKMLMAML
ncbi:uncharacterized protein KY384_001579 [Bacidia gigantensis]|uniref:uncharacterized protein n=1 Tax=Bacidia gigantensis TaxID=2732470 RepID=UPI001D03B12B|nr:uncharacterized protein KY384_001579 [Bacidia gigantensis]KAG8533838.1 hypothetical protein KY384_001579 [Bacidia gigantensis]